MLNFSIMTLNEEHINEHCEDIADQVKNKIATMPLFMMSLTPEGDPAIDKAEIYCRSYEKYKEKLDAMGVPSGVLIQATLGHGWKLNSHAPFQRYVGLTDGTSPEVYCPLDRGFQAYLFKAGARIAATHPAHIMLDDDFRLISARPQCGCACPLHLARISQSADRQVTREELWNAILQGTEKNNPLRDFFLQSQIDSLIECAKELRRGIDSVDPTIPGSRCLSDGNEGGYEIAAIMAGVGNPVVVRMNNGSYAPPDPRTMVKSTVYQAAVTLNALTKRPDVILAETDTYPQNRYASSAAKLHSQFTLAILEGAGGAKHWITRLHGYEPDSGKAYRKKLASYHGFYEELAQRVPELTWLGANLTVPTGNFWRLTPRDHAIGKSNTWFSPVLDRLGLPLYFSTRSENACFFGGLSAGRFTDEEILAFLSGKVVLDAPAAMEWIRKGFGEYLGVDVRERSADAPNASGEIFYPHGHSPAMHQVHELIPLSEKVKHLSHVYHLRDGVKKERLFPGVTSYQNKLGGTATVFSGVTNVPFAAPAAFGFLNETRKAQLAQILKELDCLPVYYPEDAEVFMKAARTRDGKLFCALLNLSLDALEKLPLATELSVRTIKRLMPDGSYEAVDFRQESDRVTLSLTAYPYDPLILLWDTEQ